MSVVGSLIATGVKAGTGMAARKLLFVLIGGGAFIFLLNRWESDQQTIGAQAYQIEWERSAAEGWKNAAARTKEETEFVVREDERNAGNLPELRADLAVQEERISHVQPGEPCPVGCTITQDQLDALFSEASR